MSTLLLERGIFKGVKNPPNGGFLESVDYVFSFHDDFPAYFFGMGVEFAVGIETNRVINKGEKVNVAFGVTYAIRPR